MRNGKCSVLSVLLVFLVFLIVTAVLFPVFARHGDSSFKARCLNNLKQCAQALKMYADDYDGQMPSSYLVSRSRQWNRRDALYFCTRRGKCPPVAGAKHTWAEVLYDHMRSADIAFCPSDPVNQNSRIAKTSYWYKVANDRAWYGVGCEKPRRSMGDYGYESDQIAFYERLGWHFGDTSGLTNRVKVSASFMDSHVQVITIQNATSGDPTNCAANSDGEPMYYNTSVDPKTGAAKKQTGPATLTDPTCSYDSL